MEERGISNVLQVGDFVDRRKFISFVTLNHVREKIFGESHKRGITWDILVGNHDTPYKNTNEINSIIKRKLSEFNNSNNGKIFNLRKNITIIDGSHNQDGAFVLNQYIYINLYDI